MHVYAVTHESRIQLYARRHECGMDLYTGLPAETRKQFCALCGAEFIPNEKARSRFYCKRQCKDRASKLRRTLSRTRGEPTGTCEDRSHQQQES